MKYYKILHVFLLVGCLISCKQKETTGRNSKMVFLMDSVYANDKNVTIVDRKDTIRLIESMKNFEDNPNITGADIDAGKQVPSPEIEYVRSSDTIRITEGPIKKGY